MLIGQPTFSRTIWKLLWRSSRRTEIFCKANINVKWIAKVGADVLDRLNIDVDTYIVQLLSGRYQFDKLAILIASIAHNIHMIVLINRSY